MEALQHHILSFEKKIKSYHQLNKRLGMSTLQLNLGKHCNQACNHCHVGAGPDRTEIMSKEVIDRALELIKSDRRIQTVDITGGAPELNPHFKYLVSSALALGKQVIDRCNLTVLFEPGQEETAQFLADHQVVVIASMPCYLEQNVNAQRGARVYEKSVRALKMLGDLGYGKPGSGLELHLVFNPGGMGLPPEQSVLEADYKHYLKSNFGIEFNQLLTITNMPIKRFKQQLEQSGKLTAYERLLADRFNPAAAERIMCRDLVSVSWDGRLYDCDFNQALGMSIASGKSIWDIESLCEIEEEIAFGNHCYGCTAGSGSSCKGALV